LILVLVSQHENNTCKSCDWHLEDLEKSAAKHAKPERCPASGEPCTTGEHKGLVNRKHAIMIRTDIGIPHLASR
jgi:hypothetical protein